MRDRRRRILVCVDWFRPAFKAGGPIQSVGAIVDLIVNKGQDEVYVLTSAYDLGDTTPMQDITPDHWTDQGAVKVRYLTRSEYGYDRIKELVQELDPDMVYCNSLFSPVFTLKVLKAAKSLGKKRILAPRGMLHPGALAQKAVKKRIFILASHLLGLFRGVQWHATSHYEMERVKKFYPGAKVTIARNLPRTLHTSERKEVGNLSSGRVYIYIGRISPEKNVVGLLESFLACTDGSSILRIAGPITHEEHGKRMLELVQASDRLEYLGAVAPAQVAELIRGAHFFVTATHGENFGHTIAEALACGRPALVPATTPWQALQSLPTAGYTFPGTQVGTALKWAEGLTEEAWREYCSNAHKRFEDYLHSSGVLEENNTLFA